jgi:drug/metabolite transporter (DMT)-like permease
MPIPIPKLRPAFRNLTAYGALLLTCALWGSNGTVARPLFDVIAPFTLSVARWIVVLVLLAPVVWPERAAMARLLRSDLRLFVTFGLLGGAMQSGLIYAGLAGSTAIHLGLLNSAVPVFIMLIAWIWHARQPRGLESLGLAVSFCGVLLILAHGDLQTLLHLDFGAGDLVMLAAMVTWAFHTIKLRDRPKSLSLFAFLFLLALVGSVLALPLVVAEWLQRGVPLLGGREIASVLYIGAMPTLTAMFLFSFSVERIGPVRAGIFAHFMPVFATLFAVTVLGEAFHLYHAAGFVLVAGGAIVSCLRPDAVVPSPPPARSRS